jgi:hypothetical protein
MSSWFAKLLELLFESGETEAQQVGVSVRVGGWLCACKKVKVMMSFSLKVI